MSPSSATSPDLPLAWFVKYAYERAPAVRRILDEAGIEPAEIKTVMDLERVPVTTKDKLVQLQRECRPFGGFLAVHPRALRHIYLSPGPLYEPHGTEQALTRVAAAIFRAASFRRGDVVLNALSYHLVPAGLLLDAALQRLGACVVPGGVGNTELQVRVMLDLRVNGYAGTPSFLLTIIRKAEEMGLNFKEEFALHHTLFTAEPYPPSLRAQFEGVYGLTTTNVYATAELGFLAYECERKAGLHLAEGVIIELVDPATGKRVGPYEPGEVVVTTFNETYPVIRLGTGDLAAYTDEACACRRRSPRLLALVGRVGEAVKVRGMFVHPNQLGMAASRFPVVARVQGAVTRPGVRDVFTLKVELAEEVGDRDELTRTLGEAVRELCRVGVDRIEFVQAGTLAADSRTMVDERKWE